MFLVLCFFSALSVVDVERTFQVFDFQVAEGLLAKIVKGFISSQSMTAYRTEFFALQLERGGWGADAVEMPMGSRHVDARAMCHSVFVNPYLILIGCQPCGVCLDGFSVNIQGWRRSLVPYLQIQFMLTFWYQKRLGHTKLQFPIKHQVELSLASNGDGLVLRHVESL